MSWGSSIGGAIFSVAALAFAWQGWRSLMNDVASFNTGEIVDFVLDLLFDWGRRRTCSDRDLMLFRRDKAPFGFWLVVTGSFAMSAFATYLAYLAFSGRLH